MKCALRRDRKTGDAGSKRAKETATSSPISLSIIYCSFFLCLFCSLLHSLRAFIELVTINSIRFKIDRFISVNEIKFLSNWILVFALIHETLTVTKQILKSN